MYNLPVHPSVSLHYKTNTKNEMKTKSLYIAALLVIGATFNSIAKDEPTAGIAVVSSKGSQVVKIIYKGENAGKVKLSILDASSKVIFTETRNSTEGFILPLNFAGLAYGEYTLLVTDANGTKSEKINYEPAQATNVIHVAQIDDSGKFLLSVTKSGNQNVNVKIYDGFNNLVHDGNSNVAGDFAQVYVIKNYSGTCTFQVSNNNGGSKTVSF
jgi:hypothetical protein